MCPHVSWPSGGRPVARPGPAGTPARCRATLRHRARATSCGPAHNKVTNRDKVTNFLQLSAADYTKKPAFTSGMTDVAASLLRKMDRDTNSATAKSKTGGGKIVNQNVLRVVLHVGLFLRSKGVPNF